MSRKIETPAVTLKASEAEAFVRKVWEQGKLHHRTLPWRNIDDPYGVYVSEVMLQQTQVRRVLKHWERWMNMWPTIDALASAAVDEVLSEWQGMGYNRRALALKRTAEICSKEWAGTLPSSADDLLALPGIGPSTAAGLRCFAFGLPDVYLETNVRTVFIHELFPDATEPVPDKIIRPLVAETCSTQDPRGWYYALLDYGAYLKKTVPNPSRRSAHHTKQSKFEGSRRQKRANLLRLVLDNPGITREDAADDLNRIEQSQGRPAVDVELFDSIVFDLDKEGFISATQTHLYAVR